MERNLRPRNTKEESSTSVLSLLKYLLFSYIFSGVLLLILALWLYRFGLSEKTVSIVITAIYLIATFLAGWLSGKKMGSRRFLWGLLVGCAYFIILAMLSLLINHSIGDLTSSFLSTLLLCAGGGMMGGMMSK